MEKIILKLPVIYQYIYENIYDSDTLNYNKHAEKTCKFIKKNDELNLISKFNEKPDFINFDYSNKWNIKKAQELLDTTPDAHPAFKKHWALILFLLLYNLLLYLLLLFALYFANVAF